MSDPSLPFWQASSATQAERTSKQFAVLASSVGESISEFHSWLRQLPGVLETELWTEDPDPSPDDYPDYDLGDDFKDCRLGVSLQRGKQGWGLHWALGYAEYSDVIEFDSDWSPIENAPLLRKAAAVKLLPELIKKMEKEQQRIIAQMASVPSVASVTKGSKKGGK